MIKFALLLIVAIFLAGSDDIRMLRHAQQL